MVRLQQINDFLAHKRLALVGVSRDPKDFTRAVFREFVKRDYQVVPVNMFVNEIEGIECHSRLQDINPSVNAALIMTPPDSTVEVVQDCQRAGVKQVWLYRSAGQGAVSQIAVEYCHEHKIDVIVGHCPLMFLPDAAMFHRFHRGFSKLFRTYPK